VAENALTKGSCPGKQAQDEGGPEKQNQQPNANQLQNLHREGADRSWRDDLCLAQTAGLSIAFVDAERQILPDAQVEREPSSWLSWMRRSAKAEKRRWRFVAGAA
jgi:hypothetical protein